MQLNRLLMRKKLFLMKIISRVSFTFANDTIDVNEFDQKWNSIQ